MKDVVVITGSSGLIGSALARELFNDYTVVGLDIIQSDNACIADWIHTDFTDTASVNAAFESIRKKHGDRLAGVIHMVAYYDFTGEESSLYDALTIEGTRRVLTALSDFKVGQFAYTSTHLVHAPCEIGEKIQEISPLEGKWQYPQSKIKVEKLIEETPTDFNSIIYRISGVYDDYCNSFPISRQIRRIYERSITSAVYPGDLRTHQPFVHLNDVVNAIKLGFLQRDKFDTNRTFLIGEPDAASYGDLQRKISKCIYGEEWETEEIPKELAKAGAWMQDLLPADSSIKPWMIELADDNYELDISRAVLHLNWHPVHRVLPIVEHMVAALKEDPAEWYHHHDLAVASELEALAKK